MRYNNSTNSRLSQSLLIAIYFIWAGLILGISFIATPVKFQAPHITMPIALEVGKVTFHLFNQIEWGMGILSLILASMSGKMLNKSMVFALAIVLAAQTFWIMPILDLRMDILIQGGVNSPSYYHIVYIIADILKLLIIIVLGWSYLRKNLAS